MVLATIVISWDFSNGGTCDTSGLDCAILIHASKHLITKADPLTSMVAFRVLLPQSNLPITQENQVSFPSLNYLRWSERKETRW